MRLKGMVPGPAKALAAGSGSGPNFFPDIIAIKDDNREWESPQKTTSQGTESAISNVFDAVNMVERQFPRVVPPRIPLPLFRHERLWGRRRTLSL
jgi:hypothetical protein